DRVLDSVLGRLLLLIEEGGGGHDPAIDAVAALRHLFLDIGLLDRMRLLGGAKAGERHHFAIADGGNRRHAGTDRLAIEMHRAGAALRKPAAEMWIVEPDVVAQRIEQRHVGIGIDRMDLAVHVEVYPSHGCMSPFVAFVGRKEGAFAACLAEDLDHSKPKPTPVPWERGSVPCGDSTRLTELKDGERRSSGDRHGDLGYPAAQ